MKIFPAIDLMDGRAVRLTKGDFSTKEIFCEDPLEVLAGFKAAGAKYLHAVDLDGARTGSLVNFKTVSELARDKEIFVEVGGGIRDEIRIEKYLSAGCGRVILGTAALRDLGFLKRAVKEFGDRIAVGIDAKDGMVAINGWEKTSDADAFQFAKNCRDAGVSTVIFTDIATDGAMSGTNIDAFLRLKTIEGLSVVASGGITYYEEIAALRDAGVQAAILGKALYKGLLDLKRAISVAEGKV